MNSILLSYLAVGAVLTVSLPLQRYLVASSSREKSDVQLLPPFYHASSRLSSSQVEPSVAAPTVCHLSKRKAGLLIAPRVGA
jgi:hypothetical protein